MRDAGQAVDEGVYQAHLRSAVADVVRRRREVGVDIPNDGEFGNAMGHRVNYRAWWSYSFQRLGGLELGGRGIYEMPARGSGHGPHTTDIPFREIVEVMLAINARASSFEAGNVRHEHEWKVWRDVELPEGKRILPGVVSHATNVVEHPELVADRILRFAELVGRERVIASTDCGLGGRVHPQIAWAKLETLVEGAALASRPLWRRRP